MKGRSGGSKHFRWGLETRLLLVEILTMVDKDQAAKRWTRRLINATPAAELSVAQTGKWEEVASRLPPVFNAIDPSRRGTTCYSQYNQLRQRFKFMRLDHRSRYRRASTGKRDPIMTTELCWKIAEYLDSRRPRRRPGHQVAMSILDNELCTASNQVVASLDDGLPLLEQSHGKHLPASNDKQLIYSTVHSKLDHESQAVALKRGDHLQYRHGQAKFIRKNDVPEMRLNKVPRSGTYRWSEDARLQVIEAVKTMEDKLSQDGLIKNWREIAANLPKHLFWDIDLDRLASIAKKQFAELRRRYRIIMSDGHDTSGTALPVKFKTLTKKVIQALAAYEEGCLQRTPSRAPLRTVRKLCNRKENALWVTVTPSDALNAEYLGADLGANGPVRVETLSRSGLGIDHENDSFGGAFVEYDPVCDDYGRDEEHSIVPNDCSWSSGYDERKSADRQTSPRECKNSESSYSKLLESEDHAYADAWEAEEVTNRERNEGHFWFDNRQSEYLDLQSRQTVSSHAYSIQPHHTTDHSERRMLEKCLHRQSGCSSAISISSSDSDPESDCHEDGAHLRNQDGRSEKGRHSQSSANSDSEESLKQGRHPNSDGNKKGGLRQRQTHWQRGRPSAVDERDSHSGKDKNPENGSESSGYQSESDHSPNSDQEEYDSVSESDNESMSHGDAHSPSHSWLRLNNNSESGNFEQSEPTEFLNIGERPEILSSKTRCANSQWGETARRGHGTSRSSHPQPRGPLINEPAKMKGEFKHGEAIPSGTVEKMTGSTSGPEHDQTLEGTPVVAKMLRGVDLEFSKLNWWVQHQLPLEREKIKDVIRSVSIPNSPNKAVGSEGICAGAVKVSRLQHQIRWVLKAELQRVRLKVFEEVDKSSQVVIQEILQSLEM